MRNIKQSQKTLNKLSSAKQLFIRSYKGRKYTSYNRVMLNDLILSLKTKRKTF